MVCRVVELINKDHSQHLAHCTHLRAHPDVPRPRNVLKRAIGLQKTERKGWTEDSLTHEPKSTEKQKLAKELSKRREKE